MNKDFKLNQEVYFILGYNILKGNIWRLVNYIDIDNPDGRITDIVIHKDKDNNLGYESHTCDLDEVFANKENAEKSLSIKKKENFANDLDDVQCYLKGVATRDNNSVNTADEKQLISQCKLLYENIYIYLKGKS